MGFVDNLLKKFFGDKSDKDIKTVMPIIDKINLEFSRISKFSADELREEAEKLKRTIADAIKGDEDEINSLKESIDNGTVPFEDREAIYNKVDKIEEGIKVKIESVLNDILPTAFAIVKDTARRLTEEKTIEVTANQFDRDIAAKKGFVDIEGDKALYFNRWNAGGSEMSWEMIHYDVQLIGGVILHQGKIAEMTTGEGKTLVATLPVFLNALTGRGVHVVTVNDYLAKRDSEWMGPIYQFHGLSVDCIDKYRPNSEERRCAYNSDITFGTNNEFGFDYLRDNMATRPADLVQRKHHYAIVDEVDSVLIDDARTPLIISGPVPKANDQQFHELKPNIEKVVAAQKRFVTETLAAAKKLLVSDNSKEKEEGALLLLRAYKGLPKSKAIIKFLSEEGIKAQMLKSENFYMQEQSKNMHVVTDPLFFIIDEKTNSVELTDQGVDVLSEGVDEADFFVLPDIGSDIADLENDATLSADDKVAKKDEMLQNYSIKTERVHTLNQLLKAYTMFEKDIEYVVMDNKVKIVDEQTGRIMEGRRYSDGLHQAIESKEDVKIEAATQTMATVTLQNYFRMYHKLSGMTGTAETEAGELWDIYKLEVVVIPTNRPIQRVDSEDRVYKTAKEKYNAIIEEITVLNKAGRPILVGTTSVEISELLSRMLTMRGIKHNVLNAKLHQREADIVAEAGIAGTVTIATNMAGRGTDIKMLQEVKDCGGLAIIGTERHDSRRVDRQLRGRAGRQGDPGSSQFFVSLQDNLMRMFASDRIIGIMDKIGLEEGEVIQHSMISKSIERAQKKVEENNFGIRKNLLEYDDVMNSQREVIYTKRRHALHGERIDADILNMMYDSVDAIVHEFHPEGVDAFEDFDMEMVRFLSIESPISKEEFGSISTQKLIEQLHKVVVDLFRRRVDAITDQAMPVIKRVYENQSDQYKNIIIPVTDGRLIFQLVCNLERAYNNEGKEIVEAYQKQVILNTIDENWKEQLRELDDLRDSVRNATYEQKDPLLIYKLESFNLFKKVLDKVNKSVVSTLLKGRIAVQENDEVKEAQERKVRQPEYSEQKQELGGIGQNSGAKQQSEEAPKPAERPKAQPIRVEKKVNRNAPCPCGSGKKFKQCHGKDQI